MDPRQELGENINYVRQIEIQLCGFMIKMGAKFSLSL
jgi:hypothetical protein